MNQVREVATSRKVTIGICMALALFAVPTSAGLLLSRTVSALSIPLLDKTIGLVTRTLHGTTTVPLLSPASQPNTTPDNSSPTNAAPASDVADPSGKPVMAPRVDQSPESAVQSDASLATIAPLDTTWLTQPITVTATSAHYTSLDVDRLATIPRVDSVPILQPTERGWSLLGVLWYWWLLVLAVISAIIARIVAVARRASSEPR